jgi:CRISPR-associated endonuclease/helicase Cas3
MATLGEEVMQTNGNPLLPDAVERFFNLRYGLGEDLDGAKIMDGVHSGMRSLSFSFKKIERDYKIIDDNTVSVVIPYDEICREALKEAERALFPYRSLRKLQRYAVSIYAYEFEQLAANGCLLEPATGVYALNELNMGTFYSERMGLICDATTKVLII